MPILISFVLMIVASKVSAQPNIVVENGQIYIKTSAFGPPNPSTFKPLTDSLDKRLKLNSNDTSCLFQRALLLEQFNNQLAKAASYTKDPIENLSVARDMAEHAVELQMKDLKLKILRAQVYKDLVYRYSVSESWKFTSKQVAERKVKCDNYKALANKYYDELALLDAGNAYDYERLKIK